jgi:hypothetical protein
MNTAHCGVQQCGISGFPASLFTCQKIWHRHQILILSRNTKDMLTLTVRATTYFSLLICYYTNSLCSIHLPLCSVIYLSPSTCSRHSCRNMRPHLFLTILCLGMILPYLPGRRESDTSRSLPRSTLLSSLPPLTPSRTSFSSSLRRWCRSCQ